MDVKFLPKVGLLVKIAMISWLFGCNPPETATSTSIDPSTWPGEATDTDSTLPNTTTAPAAPANTNANPPAAGTASGTGSSSQPQAPQPAGDASGLGFTVGQLGTYGKQPDGKFHDCRDDWPEFRWEGMTKNECTEPGEGAQGEGFLPSIAFKACKINGQCYRFATMDECHSYPFARNSGMLPTRNDALYCLEATDPKDREHRSESYFSCYVQGTVYRFQTVDVGGVMYRDKTEMAANPPADIAGQVADNLAFLKARPSCDNFPINAPIR